MSDHARTDLAQTEDSLRRALARDAERVSPPERLGAILREAHRPPVATLVDEALRDAPPARHTWLAAGAAAAAVVVAVAVGAAVTDRDRPTTPGATGSSTAPATGASASGPGTSSAAPTTGHGTTTSGTVALPVYYVGHTAGNDGADALLREFVPTTLGGADGPAARVQRAVDLALAAEGTSYAAIGPGQVTSSVNEVSSAGVELTLTSDTGSITLTPTQEAAITYTAQAAAATGAGAITGNLPVTIDLNPHTFGPLGRVGPFVRSSFGTSVLAPIWVDAPYRGQVYPAGQAIRVTGLASVFEAQFAWEVRRGDAVVASGSARAAEAAPARTAYAFTVDRLPAGDYTLRLFEPSAKGDGTLSAEVSTTFAVR